METCVGTVHSVVFRAPANSWSVLKVKVPGRHDLQVMTGITLAQPGQAVTANGVWKTTEAWGVQFAAERIVAASPTTPEGIINYLGSGLIPGVGPSTAKALVKHFGMDVLQVLEMEPQRIIEVKGVGEAKAEIIRKGWIEQRAVNEIMLFLHSQDISPALCRRIHKRYGDSAVAAITANPYSLAMDVKGIGFKTADKIAGNLSIPKDSLQRRKACLFNVVQDASTGYGHCGSIRADLLKMAAEEVGLSIEQMDVALQDELDKVEDPDVDGSAPLLVSNKSEHGELISLVKLAKAEESISRAIKEQIDGEPICNVDALAAVARAEKQLGVILADRQREGIAMALSSRVSVITGGPGTGKTTSLRVLLAVLKELRLQVGLATPTGMAARRAQEATGLPARTIYAMLNMHGDQETTSARITADYLIIDEAGMLDVPIMRTVMRSLMPNTALLLVGDVDQLPCVGAGSVLRDIIDSGVVPVTRLDVIQRQAAGSLITANAHRINRGEMPVRGDADSDFFIIPAKDTVNGVPLEPQEIAASVAAEVVELVSRRLPAKYGLDPINDIQVITPMNVGLVGVNALNEALQKVLNPKPAASATVNGTLFGVGDRVVNLRNNYDRKIVNGDTGRVIAINTEDSTVDVDFGGEAGRVILPFDDMDELRLAYAMTVHKLQGSEARAVVMPLTMAHYMMLERKLLYTGVTRAKQLFVMVCQTKALAMAVENDKASQRLTRLKQLLQTKNDD